MYTQRESRILDDNGEIRNRNQISAEYSSDILNFDNYSRNHKVSSLMIKVSRPHNVTSFFDLLYQIYKSSKNNINNDVMSVISGKRVNCITGG